MNRFSHILMILLLCALSTQVFAVSSEPNDADDLFDMSIEELMNVEVTIASIPNISIATTGHSSQAATATTAGMLSKEDSGLTAIRPIVTI